MDSLLSLAPREFVARLHEMGIERFFLAREGERGLVASHPALAPLADFLAADARDFDAHEGLFFEVGTHTRTLHGAFVHRTCRGQAAGGVRLHRYATMEDYLRDGLRLARGMTLKNALAGLWWGGGKGVIALGSGADASTATTRATIYEEYGALCTRLRGLYVTAEDAGTSVEDMAAVFRRTRFTTCIPPSLGGSGNPSVPTARGVVRGIEAGLAHLGLGGLRDRSVAIEGLGHVGAPLALFLAEAGVARIVGADVSSERVNELRAALDERGVGHELALVQPGDDGVLAAEVDVVAPCATGATLNPRTIPKIRARLVCGAANNQLEDPAEDDRRLADAGVLYLPDFLVNRMGIVNCADEGVGVLPEDPRIERHLGEEWEGAIAPLVRRVLARAESEGSTPHRVALALAEELSFEEHPLFGHRGLAIVAALREGAFDELPT